MYDSEYSIRFSDDLPQHRLNNIIWYLYDCLVQLCPIFPKHLYTCTECHVIWTEKDYCALLCVLLGAVHKLRDPIRIRNGWKSEPVRGVSLRRRHFYSDGRVGAEDDDRGKKFMIFGWRHLWTAPYVYKLLHTPAPKWNSCLVSNKF